MNKTGTLLALGALALGLFLAGCVEHPEITPAAPPPTPAAVVGPAAAGQAAPVVAATDRFPLPAPTQEPWVVDSENCITCHTDQQALQQLAVEPEHESLSEGEG